MLAKRKTTQGTDEEVSPWRQSVFTLGDKIRLVAIAVTLFTTSLSLIGVVLLFWKDTSVRLSVLEQRVLNLEHPQIVQIKPDAVAKKE